jgi:adenylate cyclase, class 2
VREIEVKYRVDDLEALQAALKARGIELSDPVYQDDQAYAPATWQFGDSKLGVSFLRLRTVNGRHYFTLKQPLSNAQACVERETEVADRQAMHHAALHMGYRPTVRITKTRRIATIGDHSLCVDDLEGIGAFIEVERLAPDDADPHAVQAELAALVDSLGITATRTTDTYDSLVHAATMASPSLHGGCLLADAGVDADLRQVLRAGAPAIGMPQRRLHEARLHQVKSAEEPCDPFEGTRDEGRGRVLVHGNGRADGTRGVEIGRGVRHGKEAPGRKPVP